MRIRIQRSVWLALVVSLVHGAPAAAQVSTPDSPAETGVAEDDWSATPRSRATNEITMQEGVYTLAGSLSFVTADFTPEEAVGSDVLRFTDVVLLNLGTRYSFGDVEIYGSTSLLPKQPSQADALFWQGARLGTRWAFVEHFALALQTAGGPLLGDLGWWSSSDLQLEARATVHSTISFMGKLGASANGLFDDGSNVAGDISTDPFWFSEVLVGGEIVLHVPGIAAFWVGADFNIPVWASDDAGDSRLAFDPQTRANFHLGAVLSYVDEWDLYCQYAVIDRGEEGDPLSVIPLLDSGFDQQQLVFGVVKYFEPDRDDYAFEPEPQ